MRLDRMTWREVEAYLRSSDGILIPAGSTEQHGPMGLIGTDALCAEAIAERAADLVGAICAPALAYAPAPFNLAFPGSISISPPLFRAIAGEIVAGLASQGFGHCYFVNGHGANLEPLSDLDRPEGIKVRVKSWWSFEQVNAMREALYGDWEGMHATPSEISITQALYRKIETPAEAMAPPKRLSPEYVRAHSGDKHGSPDQHRATFPDGRVGSHSALADPEHGKALLAAAVAAVAEDYRSFMS